MEQRETLARMLYRQTLAALCQAEGIDRVVVATSDTEVAEHARHSGALVFEENEQVSHSVSADAACLRAMEMGASTALLVPIDVPTATPADFSRLAASARPGLIVVPSSDGTGTNALVRTPPDCIESRFGPGSFRDASRSGALQRIARGRAAASRVDVRHRHSRRCGRTFGRRARVPGFVVPANRMRLEITALSTLPEVRPGDDLASLIRHAAA